MTDRCPICNEPVEKTEDQNQYNLCPMHKKLHKEGYVALFEVIEGSISDTYLHIPNLLLEEFNIKTDLPILFLDEQAFAYILWEYLKFNTETIQ